MKYLNHNQNCEAYSYPINKDYKAVKEMVIKYSKSYDVSISEAVEDLDFPVTNENRKKLEKIEEQ